MKIQTYRQGDVLIQSVPSLPKKLRKMPREGGRVVLAHGKATGHSHAIATKPVDLLSNPEDAGELFLQVKAAKADLVHDEHTTIAIPRGIYRVSRQREFSHDVIRRVED